MAAYITARQKVPHGVDAALVVVGGGGGGGGGGGRRGGSDEAPRRIPDVGPTDIVHRSARGKKSGGVHPKGDGNDGGDRDSLRRRRRW